MANVRDPVILSNLPTAAKCRVTARQVLTGRIARQPSLLGPSRAVQLMSARGQGKKVTPHLIVAIKVKYLALTCSSLATYNGCNIDSATMLCELWLYPTLVSYQTSLRCKPNKKTEIFQEGYLKRL
ncbi:hypothetical protein J6590_023934 [Homalodisca vitripennis]|nr:hypothetical protein J6590_023934 [Homalodisca vitripennis]